ncbi:MAG: histidine phosphatase family protein [bacterium]|nr:histidine phosphatase family protein [bacterium]
MKVIIVRHAETTENAKMQDIGHNTEALLTEQGVLQAQKLGIHLKGEKISHAYTSPQRRAIHTAEKILEHHPEVKIVDVEELREQSLGIYESVPKHVWKEIKAKAKEAFHLFKPEGGESYTELQKRAKQFFDRLIREHENDTVLIVSHGGTLGVLLLDILEKELTEENYRAHQPKNTEFTVIEIQDGQKKIHTVNNRAHLDLEL